MHPHVSYRSVVRNNQRKSWKKDSPVKSNARKSVFWVNRMRQKVKRKFDFGAKF